MRQTDARCVASAACSTTRAARPSCCSNPADAGVPNRPRKDLLALDFNEWAGKLVFSHQLVPFPGKQGLICVSSREWTTKARFKFPRLRAALDLTVCSWQRDWHDRSLELHAHRSVPVCTETHGLTRKEYEGSGDAGWANQVWLSNKYRYGVPFSESR